MRRYLLSLLLLLCCGSVTLAQPLLPRETYPAPYNTRQSYPDLIGSLTHYCVSTSAANTYTCPVDNGGSYSLSLTPPGMGEKKTVLTAGQLYVLTVINENTGPSTLNPSGLGAFPIKIWDGTTLTDVAAGELPVGRRIELRFDGTNFQLMAPRPGGTTTPDRSVLPIYGALYGASSWANLTGFTSNGTTPSIVSTKLQFSGGANTLTQSFDWTYPTQLYHWKMTASVLVGTPGATTWGLGIGIRGHSVAGVFSSAAWVDLTNTGTAGTLYLGTAADPRAVASAYTLTFSAGDEIVLTFERQDEIFTATAYNATTKSMRIWAGARPDYYSGGTTGGNISASFGEFALFSLGGTHTLNGLVIESREYKNADILVLGDSKSSSVYAKLYADGYPIRLQRDFRVVNLSGSGNWLVDVLQLTPEVIALAPKTVLLNIGRNDLVGGRTQGQINTDYDTLTAALVAAGIDVYHLLPLWETPLDQSAFASHITSTYATNRTIDAHLVDYSGDSANVLAPDGIHPNRFGNQLIAEAVLRAYQAVARPYVPYQERFGGVYQDGLLNVAVGTTTFPFTVSHKTDFNLDGVANTAVGFRALDHNQTGNSNTCLGYQACASTTTGNVNTALGSFTLGLNTTGGANIAIGGLALLQNTTGGSNVAIGTLAMTTNTTGLGNTALSNGALNANTTGNYNVAVGNAAGSLLTTGSNNLILGTQVGQTTLVTGSRNILLGTGSSVDTPTASTSDYLNIGGLLFGDLSATRKFSVFVTTPVIQQTRGATLTNNVVSSGTTETCADFTSLTVYATDAQAIHDCLYWLAHALRQWDVALRAYGLGN